MKKKRRSFEIFSLSFLDVISCGFGAIVLLLVIMKISEPLVVENTTSEIQASIERYKLDTETLKKDSAVYFQTIKRLHAKKDDVQDTAARVRQELSSAKKDKKVARIDSSSQEVILKQLYRAQQQLTEEMRRLQQQRCRQRRHL